MRTTTSLQPFSQNYDLASYTTYVVSINFIHDWRHLQFKVEPERYMFDKLFSWQFYLIFERKWPKKYFDILVLTSDLKFELGP